MGTRRTCTFYMPSAFVFQTEACQPVVEGILDIVWGVHQLIQFKIQDEYPIPRTAINKSPVGFLRKGRMTRWGEFDDLYHISEPEKRRSIGEEELYYGEDGLPYDSNTLWRPPCQPPTSPMLYRTMSEAALVRGSARPALDKRDKQRHGVSINGHFYNHETSVFTPTFGSKTKVRVSSVMRTGEVIQQLLQKFKIENEPRNFALYLVHATGEKQRLAESDIPLLQRLLQGPSDRITKIFLMDREEEEISSDVACYINLHLSFLESILQRLKEEEEWEVQETMRKYKLEKVIIERCLLSKKLETTV
ncbi:ras association domain-containing protein 6 isoform X2 [Tachyglossus aculeatus]|uniref:ras association domain-containing protein 6 isoform X2 n=1 Tax=Tachyglossus aculeatus TaxID=9261 RepID=UPI0018F78564|nr:ras association domain-containing protein 6 isoform X2 [Tachyglossus aculeatus]